MTIQPFTLAISNEQLEDLQSRLKHVRLPEPIEGTDWERGVPVAYMKKLIRHWATTYDWREQEARINTYPQFTTTVDGQLIHFFHIRSEQADATPLLLLHGWPSSSIEYLKVIEPLTNPKNGKAFHLIIPTIPGFGLSSPVKTTGWQSPRTAQAYVSIMHQLGYTNYGIHGSDIGADILGEILKLDAPHILGSHMATDTSTVVFSVTAFMGGGDPSQNPQLTAGEKKAVETIQADWKEGDGYLRIQSTKPQTLGYGLNDSPAGQLAWQVEKYKTWTNPSDELPEDKIDIDQMLTNISLYWFTGGGAASASFIYENFHANRAWGDAGQDTPKGFAVFNAASFTRKLMDPEHKVGHWTEFSEGQHFPAMEAPGLLTKDIQTFFANITA